MRPLALFALLSLSLVVSSLAFSPTTSTTTLTTTSATTSTKTQLYAIDWTKLQDVGYTTQVSKPMGVVFGENKPPASGLVVDDIELGSAGGTAGLRVGDQLVMVGDATVVGKDFETVMTKLKESPDPMTLRLYRGNVGSLYTILDNRGAIDDEDDEDEEVEEVIMDENYESPVKIDLDNWNDDDSISVGDVFNAFKKVMSGGDAAEGGTGDDGDNKKKGGLFGGMFGGETIQLDGNDANSLK